MTGGQYDVDVKLEDPKNQVLYEVQKTQFDSKQFTAEVYSLDLTSSIELEY